MVHNEALNLILTQLLRRNLGEAISAMDLEYSNESLTGTLIGIGADYVGQTVKNMLSPNSAEADAVEREWQKR